MKDVCLGFCYDPLWAMDYSTPTIAAITMRTDWSAASRYQAFSTALFAVGVTNYLCFEDFAGALFACNGLQG